MKSLTKLLATILLVVLTLSFPLAACADPGDSGAGTPPAAKTSVDVIKESVAELEASVFENTSTSGNNPLAYVAPNASVEYANELQSIFRGSGMGLYTADYVATYFDNFEVDTVYLDNSIAYLKFMFQAKNSSTGVNATLEMNNGDSTNQIKTYFNYDYTLNKPTDTTVVTQMASENTIRIAIAKFIYGTSTAYSFEIVFAGDNIEDARAKLTNGTFNFEQFIAYDILSYKLAKINLENKTIESYVYGYGTIDATATQEQVGALYNEIYASVKGAIEPIVYLDTSNAIEKEYYVKLYSYISSKASVLVHENKIVPTYIDYSTAKTYLTVLSNELTKDKYASEEYDTAKSELSKCLNYINSITEKEYCGQIAADGMTAFTSPSIDTGSDAVSYYFTNAAGSVGMAFTIKNGELISVGFAN